MTIFLIVFELLKRVAKDKVDQEVLAPILPDMTPKNKKLLEGTASDEEENQSIEQSSKEESLPEIGDKEPTQRKASRNNKTDSDES